MALDKKFWLATTLFAGAIIAPTFASAQSQSSQDQASTSTQSAKTKKPEQSAGTEVSGIVVTGSRIHKSEYNSSSPIQVITHEQAELRGLVDTGQILQSASVASGAFQVNNLLTGYVTTGGENASTINLRGLGADRTLVLLNGRRLPPAGVGGTVGPVDLNVIPSSIIDRVEILKDGASSIYGSDAVAGVVNLITKKNTDGIQLDVFGDKPLKAGGGGQERVSATWGKVFDKGYVTISGDYTEIDALRIKDRSYLSCAADYVDDPTTHKRLDFTDPTTGKTKCYNLWNNAFQAYDGLGGVFQAVPAGSTTAYPADATNTQPWMPGWVRAARAGHPDTFPYANYNTPAYGNGDAISPIRRYTVYATGGYNLTSDAEAYGEFMFNRRVSSNYYERQLFPWVDPTNPENTVASELQDAAAHLGAAASGWARPIIAIPQYDSQSVDYTRFVGGLRGQLPFGGFLHGWSYDVYGMYGRSDGSYTDSFVYADRVNATTSGGVACDQSQIISGATCMGIPWFDPRVLAGNFTSAERAFLFGKETGHTLYDQYTVEASITGDLFTLPAGKVGAAFGVDYRHDHIDDQPGANAQEYNWWGYTTAGRTVGSDATKEIYGELNVPVFRAMPFIQRLDIDASARYTDYDSYGGGGTYKLGLNWQVIPSVRFRGTLGTSFRAPALYEQFLANQTSYFNGMDPCANWGASSNPKLQKNCAAAGVPSDYPGYSATPEVFQGGGVGHLKAETSKAKTVSVIWTPKFVDLKVTVDYTEIEVDNEVTNFGAQNILNQCYAGVGTYPNDFCKLFTRDPSTHDILTINDDFENIQTQKVSGLDLTTQYRRDLGFAKLTLDTQMTWTFRDVQNLLGGQSIDNLGLITRPAFTGVINTRLDRGDWTLNWAVDMYGRQSDVTEDGGAVPTTPSTVYGQYVEYKYYTNFTAYHTLSLRRKFDKLQVELGVQNLADTKPPALSTGEFRLGTSALNAYDFRGRRIFLALSKKW